MRWSTQRPRKQWEALPKPRSAGLSRRERSPVIPPCTSPGTPAEGWACLEAKPPSFFYFVRRRVRLATSVVSEMPPMFVAILDDYTCPQQRHDHAADDAEVPRHRIAKAGRVGTRQAPHPSLAGRRRSRIRRASRGRGVVPGRGPGWEGGGRAAAARRKAVTPGARTRMIKVRAETYDRCGKYCLGLNPRRMTTINDRPEAFF